MRRERDRERYELLLLSEILGEHVAERGELHHPARGLPLAVQPP